MSKVKCRKAAAFNKECQNIQTPILKFISHHKAVENVTFTIVRNALMRIGYARKEASQLAGSTPGTARQRFETITADM